MLTPSILAPKHFPNMPPVAGVSLAVYPCHIKYKNRNDMLVARFAPNTKVAGVFTKSTTASANVLWGRSALKEQEAQILVVNAGNANAFNGDFGMQTIDLITNTCAKLWSCSKNQVFPCATGVIGQPMPNDKIIHSLNQMAADWQEASYEDAAKAICTTDTFAKGAYRQIPLGGKTITICGIAKGSGMIAPNMATMLGYIFTDAAIDPVILQKMVSEATEESFNAITVDSDTSTSDSLLVFATGQAHNETINSDETPIGRLFKESLFSVMLELAHQVVKDGEGASKFIKVTVTGAQNNPSAKKIALAIANSPLVKTAITGCDANWGRIIMAIGKSEEPIDATKISISVGDSIIVQKSQLNPAYQEADVTAHMQGTDITISVDVGIADGQATVWTCNLTHAYIDINADYRS